MDFIKKNKVILIVAALIVLFVASIALTPKPNEYLKDSATVAEWEAITFGTRWNNQVPATKVICSDGVVALR